MNQIHSVSSPPDTKNCRQDLAVPAAAQGVITQHLAADFVGPELTFADWPTVRGIMRLKRAINEGTTQHLDALGNLLQIGDQLESEATGQIVTITELLSGGVTFAYRLGKRRHISVCRAYVRLPVVNHPHHLDALGNASHLDALPQLALCNSCLRIRRFASYEAANRSDCLCGAKGVHADSYCACCESVAELLLAGQRTGLPGIPERFDLSRWTPENGLPVEDYTAACSAAGGAL